MILKFAFYVLLLLTYYASRGRHGVEVSAQREQRRLAQNYTEEKWINHEIGTVYDEGAKLIYCACAKCGSSTLRKYLDTLKQTAKLRHEKVHGKGTFSRSPFQRFKTVKQALDKFRSKQFLSLAIIRDPKERLLSAWKNKVTCEAETYLTETIPRYFLVRELVADYNKYANSTKDRPLYEPKYDPNSKTACLSWIDFLEILAYLHEKKLKDNPLHHFALDQHWEPQRTQCFSQVDIKEFRHVLVGMNVTNREHEKVLRDIAKRYTGDENDVNILKSQRISGKPKKEMVFSTREKELLDFILKGDYEYLQPYLNASRS